jgi:hypothetical protein
VLIQHGERISVLERKTRDIPESCGVQNVQLNNMQQTFANTTAAIREDVKAIRDSMTWLTRLVIGAIVSGIIGAVINHFGG